MRVGEVLGFGGLKTARILAGRAGLTRHINSVSVLEVAEKQISEWAEQNQLFITSFYAIRDDVAMQKIVVETLNHDQCCGLVLCHTGIVLQEVSPSLVQLCDELSFPLIAADPKVAFVDIINPILSKLSDREKQSRGELSLRSDFIDLLTSDKRVQDILELFAFKVGREISFFNPGLDCIYSNKSEIDKVNEQHFLHECVNWKKVGKDNVRYHLLTQEGQKSMLYHIQKETTFFGFLHICYQKDDTLEDVLAIAESLALPCILLLNKKHSYQDMVRRHQQTFFSDLLIWNFTSDERVLTRASELGIDLTDKHYFVVVNLNAYQGDPKQNQELTHYIQRWYYPKVEQLIRAECPSNILHFSSDTLLILLAETACPPQDISRKIIELFSASNTTTVSVGVSKRFSHFKEIPDAYQEAFEIAIMGRTVYGENHVATFLEVGMLFYLRRHLKQQAGARDLCNQLLQPLRDSDEHRETELIATARALFQYQLNIKLCAEKLHIHRNTLLYRKNQMQELMGFDPFVTPHSFTFMAALFMDI